MNLALFWLIVGAALCFMELLVPTAFVESALGIAAFVVALLSLVVPSFNLQVVLWMVLSLGFIFLLKRFSPKTTPRAIAESTEGRTLTAIAPGETGRVLYEGNSWQARCDDQKLSIDANEPVFIVSRKGNTLFVLPERELNL
ncbi:MAG: NfeD family protein [Cyanobacteria bacterium P01_H01_bin.119]|mgnify:CR=1 FL=1